jgi:hypothetical protein
LTAFPGEAGAYLLTLLLFSYVICGSALLRHEMLLLACIPPVFVALIVGFTMALYASATFGPVPTIAALAVGLPPAIRSARSLSERGLLIAIYLAWAVALVMALVAFSFPDHA